MTDSARDLVAVLDEVAALAVRRVRHRSPAWWRTPLSDGERRTRADAVADLIATLVRLEQRVGPDQAPAGYERPARPPRDDVLADQLAVVAYDLLLALRARPDRDTAAEAVAACVLATYEVDPRPVPGAHLDAALAGPVGALRDRLGALPRQRDT